MMFPMLEVLFCCPCDRSGIIPVSRRVWMARKVAHKCPRCDRQLLQQNHHFELVDRDLQRERIKIIYKSGALSKCERARLREIHEALGNAPADQMKRGDMDLVLKRGAAVMALVRDEMMEEAQELKWVEEPTVSA